MSTKAAFSWKAIVGGLLLLILLAAGTGYAYLLVNFRKSPAKRLNWVRQAIADIDQRRGDAAWLARELADMADDSSPKNVFLSHDVMRFANGDWLIYRQHCSKARPHNVDDTFIAFGSDGQWYYTTCHFCIDFFAMHFSLNGRVPCSLAHFAEAFHLTTFDGQAENGLAKTQMLADDHALEAGFKACATPNQPALHY